jgi:hypothetical protein
LDSHVPQSAHGMHPGLLKRGLDHKESALIQPFRLGMAGPRLPLPETSGPFQVGDMDQHPSVWLEEVIKIDVLPVIRLTDDFGNGQLADGSAIDSSDTSSNISV